jgi:tetratricopeptide (TPR) repeat protein
LTNNPRIDELRRRIEKDPASIAFAQLAEEYRREGQYEEAVHVCRTGLTGHPTYLSARVTLGRALIELEQYDDAQTELEYVLRTAPENLAAIRGLAEIHQRRGEPVHEEPPFVEHATEPDETPSAGTTGFTEMEPGPAIPQSGLAGEWELETFSPISTTPPHVDDALAEELPHDSPPPVDPVVLDPAEQAALASLESWLEAILKDKEGPTSKVKGQR